MDLKLSRVYYGESTKDGKNFRYFQLVFVDVNGNEYRSFLSEFDIEQSKLRYRCFHNDTNK